MTSNTTPPPYVASASSEVPNTSGPTAGGLAFQAFSADINSGWTGFFIGIGTYLQFDYGVPAAKALSSYSISLYEFSAKFFPGRTPRDWTIEASADLLTWDVLDTRTGQVWQSFGNPSLPSLRTYQCDVALGTRYRYFRMNISANNGDPTYVTVSKWELGASFDHFY